MKTVNFLEAVNSGKRFRPTDETRSWWFFDTYGQLKRYVVGDDETRNLELHRCDYSNVFELEEKKIEITESEFDSVWARNISCHEGMTNNSYRESFKSELGFTND